MKIIRLVDKKHLKEIMAIEERSFTVPWTKNMFADEFTKDIAYYVGAEQEDTLIGYGGFWKILDEAHITNIAVAPEFRRQGVGKQLLDALIELSQELDITCMTLEVRMSNMEAIGLYKSFGFIEAGRRKGYYEDNHEDALIMWKTFSLNTV